MSNMTTQGPAGAGAPPAGGRAGGGDISRIRNGGISYWYSQIGVPSPQNPLPGSLEADVAIVGAGFTGLWAAYYLKRARPDLHVVLIEKHFAGYGASGRNGGWLSAALSGPPARYAATHGRDGVVALLRAMRGAIDEVISVTRSEGIDADIVKDGVLEVARNPAQAQRLRASVVELQQWGATNDDIMLIDKRDLDERVRINRALAASYSPHCARVQPAKLVQGLAGAVRRSGAVLYEDTTATSIEPHLVHTNRGTVRARIVLRCLEGYTASLRGQRRNWLPLNSAIIVTEPLDDARRAQVGWSGAELLGDSAHAYMYAQRTADNRIALGGRGVPYRFASRTDREGATQAKTIHSLIAILHDMFPSLRAASIEQAWCGVLGVPRDWCTTVNFDPTTGMGSAGGYVGNGLTTTNLAGRTLADLALGCDSELTRLAWVGRTVRTWEPEPFRWLGVHAMYGLYHLADRLESRSHSPRTSSIARLADMITGH